MRKGQIRKSEILKKRKRREATERLRIKYINASTEEERNAILKKLMKVNPYISIEQFLKPIEKKLNKTEK
ncbi:MAG: hypothetical protein ABIL20_08340 [candidate division WOR-3 bacterium]